MTIPPARRMNLIARAFLITAVIALVMFHLLPMDGSAGQDDIRGWSIWGFFWDALDPATIASSPVELMVFGTMISTCLLVLAAPFSLDLLQKSRPLWWISAIISATGLGLVGWSCLELQRSFHVSLPKSLICLLTATALNFIGLLFIRRELPAKPIIDQH